MWEILDVLRRVYRGETRAAIQRATGSRTPTQRLGCAGFEEEHTLEGFDWDAPVTFDRDRVRDPNRPRDPWVMLRENSGSSS